VFFDLAPGNTTFASAPSVLLLRRCQTPSVGRCVPYRGPKKRLSMEQAIRIAIGLVWLAAILLGDVDHFKLVNDT
jgi:hypothetical protein